MSEFTAQSAREIVAKESYTSKGYVIDQIKNAARNGQHSVGISELNLTQADENHFTRNGFTITGNNISWLNTEEEE